MGTSVGCIEIVIAGDPDQGEEAVAPGIGEGGAPPVRRRGLGDGTDRPVRDQPFAGSMEKGGGELDQTGLRLYRRGLDGREEASVSFPVTVLKVLAGHPAGRLSIDDLKRAVAILICSGENRTNRTREPAGCLYLWCPG